MCGINGIYAFGRNSTPVDMSEVISSRDSMRPRGPDGAGVWCSDNQQVGFGHRRLAIIDLSELGSQPMSTEDGRYTITFNGEIYNYRELRDELLHAGVTFRSHSDTEVLLHLYLRDGVAMLKRLRGMFAFAIWDTVKQQLLLARDPYGIKPLFYSTDGNTFRFASQVQALLAGGGVSKEIDPGGMVGFFLWGSVPEPLTLYRDIRLLPAGSSVCISARGIEPVSRYWQIGLVIAASMEAASDIPMGSERDYFREAMHESMRLHLVADVPVGAFLSAGLDSSTMVGLATEISRQSIESITFTCDEFKGKSTDEMPLASLVASHYQAKHHKISITTQDMEDSLPQFLGAMDQLTVDGINTWFVSAAAAKVGLKVVLSGLGGDELLGGYASFRDIPARVRAARRMAWIPGVAQLYQAGGRLLSSVLPAFEPKRAASLSLGASYEGSYQIQRGLLMPWDLAKVMDKEFAHLGLRQLDEVEQETRRHAATRLDGFARVVELESTRYMRNQLLRDTDWTGMAHSLEIRTPLVDSRLTEKVVGLAALGRLGEGKSMLPQALERPLPQALMSRPKTGFTVPIWKWLRHSESVDAWRRVKALRQPQVHDETRWAFSVAAHLPEMRNILK